LHGYRDIKSRRFWGHDLDPLGSHDVITRQKYTESHRPISTIA